MAEKVFDLMVPELSYLFGFLSGDGTLQRQRARGESDGRGKLSVELSAVDAHLLYDFQRLLPCYSSLSPRTRNTNFKQSYESVVWALFDQKLRLEIERLGIPVGRKSEIVPLPREAYVEDDYWRGLIDADGSVGLDDGLPFVSFVTSSDYIALGYLNYLYSITRRRKTSSRNSRDGVYNIVVWKEQAQQAAARLYYPNALALSRKAAGAADIAAWVRPPELPLGDPSTRWLPSEDLLLWELGEEAAADLLPERTAGGLHQRYLKLQRRPELLEREVDFLYAGMDPGLLPLPRKTSVPPAVAPSTALAPRP